MSKNSKIKSYSMKTSSSHIVRCLVYVFLCIGSDIPLQHLDLISDVLLHPLALVSDVPLQPSDLMPFFVAMSVLLLVGLFDCCCITTHKTMTLYSLRTDASLGSDVCCLNTPVRADDFIQPLDLRSTAFTDDVLIR